jgi:hypothetical protein
VRSLSSTITRSCSQRMRRRASGWSTSGSLTRSASRLRRTRCSDSPAPSSSRATFNAMRSRKLYQVRPFTRIDGWMNPVCDQ